MKLFTFLLLAATLSPVEQSYGPYARPERGGRPALAVGSNGTLLAWSETIDDTPRIRIGLLNSRAQLISEITTLPLATNGAEAYAPAVAFNGESFLVAWIERYRSGERIASIGVDGNGMPIALPQKNGLVLQDDVTPLIVWNGAAWNVLQSQRSGVQSAATNGASIAWTRTSIFGPPCGFKICGPKAYRWDVAWSAGDKSGSERIGDAWPLDMTPVGMANIAPAGDDFAIAWATDLDLGYRLATSNRSQIVHTYVDDNVAPGLACDDERCLVAYGTWSNDVHAIVFDRDNVENAEQLTIAESNRTEHSPLVHSLGAGRFLVSYLSDLGESDQRINGRIVNFASPTKRRAIR